MAETLGSLCDKLTIVKLKQYHTEDNGRLESLSKQETQLCEEIDSFISQAISGQIALDRLVFKSNKVFKKDGNVVEAVTGSIGVVFSRLSEVNCLLWHEQEKVYEFENVPEDEKNSVVKKLALLNLERNECIDQIDNVFYEVVKAKHAT